MHVNRIDIDSNAYGRNFLELKEYTDSNDFGSFEREYIERYDPFYVFCKMGVEQISQINTLIGNGFGFIEYQIREQLKLKKVPYPIFNPYQMELATDDDMDEIIDIAETTFEHDRFSIDPLISRSFSSQRYKAYVLKSHGVEDEYLYKTYNKLTNEIVGFKTHKIIGDEAIMFLGGVVNKYKKTPIPVINSYLELNELQKRGIKKITTHISGSNYGVLNLEVKEFGYKVVNGFVVLRKVYGN